MASRYFVRRDDVIPYSPANHSGTVNRRLIGPANVGAMRIELVLGIIQKNKGTRPHSHPGIEQVCYILEGRAVAEIGGERQELGPGDCCYCPPGVPHIVTAISETPVQLLVIYSPPYEENQARVTTPKP